MEDNNSYDAGEELSVIGDKPEWHEEVDSAMEDMDVDLYEMAEDMDVDLEKVAEEADIGSGNRPNYLEGYDFNRFEISEGIAADVAYMAWEQEGTVTPSELSMMSSSEKYSNVAPLSTKAAREGLEAMSRAGLVRIDLDSEDDTTGYAETIDMFEDKDYREENLEIPPVKYDAGTSQQFRRPEDPQGEISDPAKAFQAVGRMQEEYDFDPSVYTDMNDYL